MAEAPEGSGSRRGANTRNGDAEHVQVHHQLLYANATRHRWAFGAIAEMVDNAVAEIDNGATVVRLDQIVNPRNQKPALLVADNGAGMHPHSLRQSMTFPSITASCFDESVLGHYQNGLKTTTMRLGADTVVFTVCPSTFTASVALLSYTYLAHTFQKDTVVPILNYNCIKKSGTKPTSRKWSLKRMQNESNEAYWKSLLETILTWSPYSTEKQLLDVLYSIGEQGTQIVVYNLWRNNDRETELDFESCEDDIQIRRSECKPQKLTHFLHQQHIADRFRYSLRAYLSILYLRWPADHFSIILRGRHVEHYNMLCDMKFSLKMKSKLPVDLLDETNEMSDEVIGEVGFVKEAPLINIRGFNLYYNNRLIVPFWRSELSSGMKAGIVGIMELDFLKPSPGKEEFERTPMCSFMEGRIIQMCIDFWKNRSDMITYGHNDEAAGKNPKKLPVTSPVHDPAEGPSNIISDEQAGSPPVTTPGANADQMIGVVAQQVQHFMDENRNLKEKLNEFEELKEQHQELKEQVRKIQEMMNQRHN